MSQFMMSLSFLFIIFLLNPDDCFGQINFGSPAGDQQGFKSHPGPATSDKSHTINLNASPSQKNGPVGVIELIDRALALNKTPQGHVDVVNFGESGIVPNGNHLSGQITGTPGLSTNLPKGNELDISLQNHLDMLCRNSLSHSVYCVRFCQEIQDYKEELKNRRILENTKQLLRNTIKARLCSKQGEEEKYFCSLPERENPFADDIFLLVTTGWSSLKQISSTEFFDLSDSLRNCRKWPDFPIKVQTAVSANIDDKFVLLCGGNINEYDEEPISDCFKLDISSPRSWTRVSNMQVKRSHATGIYLPEFKSVFVTGGTTQKIGDDTEVITPTTEIFDDTTAWNYGPELPEPISHHCMVHLPDNRILVIGGITGKENQSSKKVWILNWKSNEKSWTPGPDLLTPRVDLSCGFVTLKNGSFAVVAAGGRFGESILSSTETILVGKDQPVTGQWIYGPELPFETTGASMIQVPLSSMNEMGVLHIGGYVQKRISGWGLGFSSKILLLRDQGSESFSWEPQLTSLKNERFETAAVVIKKDNFNCT